VRFRKDNGEQRFIYANDIAWKAMRKRVPVYPDGAMFGKVAFSAGEDPSFPNSMEPRAFSRMQLMRKDSRAYKNSNGWGYAILVGHGHPPYDSVTSVVTACHACHMAVPERDYVFSTPAFLGDGFGPSPALRRGFKARFETEAVATLSAFQRAGLANLQTLNVAMSDSIKSLSMDMFAGSLNESIGVLGRFVSEDRFIYAMWDDPHRRFLIVAPLPPTARCAERAVFVQTIGRRLDNTPTMSPVGPNATTPVRTGVLCNGITER
jgi:hypothetical protein